MEGAHDFLVVKPGDLVVVEVDELALASGAPRDWWLGYVIHVMSGARDHRINSLFQVADVDTGLVRTINADLVKGVLIQNFH